MSNREKIELKAGVEKTIQLPKTIDGLKTYAQIEYDYKGTNKRLNFAAKKGASMYSTPVQIAQPITHVDLYNRELLNEGSHQYDTIVLKSDEDLHIAFSIKEID